SRKKDGGRHLSCPFAGMTRIRFKGFFSAQNGHPSEQRLIYARGQGCQCVEFVLDTAACNPVPFVPAKARTKRRHCARKDWIPAFSQARTHKGTGVRLPETNPAPA